MNNKRNVDAAGNNVQKKYHFGKRDAYNRFMGKDWYGCSISIGNLAARAKYLLENDNKENNDVRMNTNTYLLQYFESHQYDSYSMQQRQGSEER